MPRIKSTEIELRDHEIVEAARRNIPRRDIARKYGISESRVSQIVTQNLDPKYPDEDLRAWLLEGYFGDLQVLQEIKEGPGRAITSGRGEHVIDAMTGLPAYDPSPRIDAIRTAAQARKNVATLMGSEKPPAKAEQESPELAEALDWMRQLARENEQLKKELASMRARNSLLEGAHPAEVVDLTAFTQTGNGGTLSLG